MNEDGDDDDTPWADPAIRASYEAALGKFILAFNQIDFYLAKILRLVIPGAGSDTMDEVEKLSFTQKVLLLRFLSHTSEGKNLKTAVWQTEAVKQGQK